MLLERLAAQSGLVKEYTEYKLKSALEKANNSAQAQVSYKNISASQKPNNDAVVANIKDSAFQQKLYKNISDYYAGNGNRSKDTSYELEDKDQNNASLLNTQNPVSGGLYSGYRTAGFSYSSKARFISGIDLAVQLSESLKKIYKVR